MKKRLLLSFVAAISFYSIVYAQTGTISFDQLNDGQVRNFDVPGNVFSLVITGAPLADSVRVVFSGEPTSPVRGQRVGNLTRYDLNRFVSSIARGEKKQFAIVNGRTQAVITSFSLTGASAGTEPVRSNGEGGDDIPVAFYDAQAIYVDYDKFVQGGDLAVSILAKYNIELSGSVTVKSVIEKNPFFKKFDLLFGKKISKDGDDKVGAQSAIGGLLANLSGIDVTKHVQAAADFLRDRVKEELALAFIDRFRKALESIPELKAVLPKTYNVFTTSDIFKVPSFGQTYKTAFQEDLENFIENFEMLVDTNPKYEALRRNEGFTAFRIAYHTIDMSANDFHPIDIFDNLDAKFGLDATVGRVANINKYVTLLNLVSQNLRKKQLEEAPENGWIGMDDLRKFNPKAMLLFWGLLYEQRHEVFDEITISSKNLTTLILEGTDIVHAGSSLVQVHLKQFVTLANSIDERIKEFKKLLAGIKDEVEEVRKKAIQDFIANADKLVEITDFIFKLPYFKDEIGTAYFTSDYYVKWRPIIFDVIETTKGIHAKDYGKIAVNATSLISHLTGMQGGVAFPEVFIENFTFYSNFIVDVINADSADDVKAVLNRYAEPVGSYRVKRKAKFSVSVNAYPGLYFGVETYKGTSSKAFGVTAPIGLSFNWGGWGKKDKDWSFSVFLNAVDIAAALSYRWSNDSLDLPEKITLGQIFAPGGHFVVGLPRVPISLKVGAQYVPELRTITKDGNTIGNAGIWRFGISGAVDIPIFNFYNRSKVK